MSLSSNISEKAALIWAIADKLTGVYKPHEYGEVILPMTVIRRFDCALRDTKQAVLDKYEKVKKLPNPDVFLRQATGGYKFYNVSKYTFEKLLDEPDNIESNFRVYLEGFSENVRDILDNFDFDKQITKMADKGLLYNVIMEFTSPKADMHPNAISNLEMGYIFEEIIRRFSEAHNEDAGQHYTPREVIRLMVNILFYDDNEILSGKGVVKRIYDPACGTGGMLSVAEEYLHELNKGTGILPYGQEINDQTFAICKADMLIKGNDSEQIRNGNTLSDDKFIDEKFDYILSNPPFGREWKNEKSAIEREAKLGFAGRFGVGLPAVSDGQMLFLLTAISKMKEPKDGGSRIAIIHNGSPLFTGDAGSGPSEIRKYIIENDLLEAIIALPNDIFYNTGIATYIWVLSNKKAGTKREGKVQLINANGLFEKRRKALGNKRNDIPQSAIEEITKLYGEFRESEISRIFDNEDFGYTKIVVERPFRPSYSTAEDRISILEDRRYIPDLFDDLKGFGEYNPPAFRFAKILRNIDQTQIFYDEKEFEGLVKAEFEKIDWKWEKFTKDYVIGTCCRHDPNAPILYKKGKPVPNTNLRDTETVPLKEDIQEYFKREVLPFAPDAWIDEKKSKIGYEIPFTRYFYKYEAPRNSSEIMAEILDLETELSGSLEEIFNV